MESLRKKILYQSTHRGCREMDFLLGTFVAHNINKFTLPELAILEELLTQPDPILYDIITAPSFMDPRLRGDDMREAGGGDMREGVIPAEVGIQETLITKIKSFHAQ